MSPAKKVILLVEDERALISMYKKALSKLPAIVEIATTCEEALSKVQKTNPDVIILDLIIPEQINSPLDFQQRMGYRFLRKIRQSKDHRDVRVIVLTNLDSVEDRKKAKELRAIEYIVKSDILPKNLVEKIHSLLEQ